MSQRRFSVACERNREPIRQVLARWLPDRGRVLEVSSGTGQHVAHFAEAFAQLRWMPSDRSGADFDSIRAWTEGLDNVDPPRVVDVLDSPDEHLSADVVFNANMIHISPFETTSGLFRWAAHVLPAGGQLILYGPYFEDGVETAPSNLAFDVSLRQRDPSWGIRRREDVDDLGAAHGFVRRERVEMPANNLLLRYLFATPIAG